MVRLEDLDAALDAATLEHLGDSLLCSPGGESPLLPIDGFFDDEEGEIGGLTRTVRGERQVEIRKADVPGRPGLDWTFRFVKSGADYVPVDAKSDKTGRWWVVKLKKKPA